MNFPRRCKWTARFLLYLDKFTTCISPVNSLELPVYSSSKYLNCRKRTWTAELILPMNRIKGADKNVRNLRIWFGSSGSFPFSKHLYSQYFYILYPTNKCVPYPRVLRAKKQPNNQFAMMLFFSDLNCKRMYFLHTAALLLLFNLKLSCYSSLWSDCHVQKRGTRTL
jgi:hypothetical protein